MTDSKNLPKLRPGFVLNLFTQHYFNTLIDKRLASVGLRTRSNRKISFSQLWRYLFIGRQYAQSFYKFIMPYPRLMGQLECKNDEYFMERVFGRRCRFRSKVFEILLKRRRLPLFTEAKARGFDNINAIVQSPCITLSLELPHFNQKSYSLDEFFNFYTKNLNLSISISAIEWLFDLLYSLDKSFPSLETANITYYHQNLDQIELLDCFKSRYQSEDGFLQFVHKLKMGNMTFDEFLKGFIDYVSERLTHIQFEFTIVRPSNQHCFLIENTQPGNQQTYFKNNLHISCHKNSQRFNLLKKK